MKRILIYLLLMVHLLTGMAFAMDTHPEAVVGYNPAAIELLAADDCDGDLYHGDHCGHASAHMVGLILCQTTQLSPSNKQSFFVRLQTPAHLYIAPLLRPPIA